MRHRPGALFTAFCLSLLACSGLLAAEKASPTQAAPAAKAAPLTIDQVIALLEAKVGEKVILRQIEATGTRLTMTVDTLLSLKGAGASDALLEALQEETSPWQEAQDAGAAAASESPAHGIVDGEHPFRVFLMEDDAGGRVVHITNLDENGKRIGGELPEDHRASRNVMAPGEQPHPSYEPQASRDAGAYGGGSGTQPVIVNVYNNTPDQASDGTALIGGSEPIGGAYIQTGVYPGYFNYGYGYSPTIYPHGALVGPRYGHGGVIYSPPGSYSHYQQYHRPDGAHQFRGVSMYPYNYGIPAGRRNNIYFGRR